MVKIDLGCGKSKQPGFIGFDQFDFEGVDVVTDLTLFPWSFRAENYKAKNDGWNAWTKPGPLGGELLILENSVDEAHCSHFVEHLDQMQRIHFWNELYRVMKPGASARIIVPHWSSCRAYGDPTHKWPPMSEFCWYYLNKKWRDSQTPHLSQLYTCDFESTWAYSLDKTLENRNAQYQQFAVRSYKDAIMDMSCTLVKLVPQ